LGEVDADGLQNRERRFVLHTLGDRLVPEIVREADDCLDEVLVRSGSGEVTYEVDVDLQVADRQCLQVGELREAPDALSRELKRGAQAWVAAALRSTVDSTEHTEIGARAGTLGSRLRGRV
jgi:hypothetical protein